MRKWMRRKRTKKMMRLTDERRVQGRLIQQALVMMLP
jgi:hypothetical protein